jgi:acyl-coenzyme A thioesterase PaaI-like protein
MLIEKLNNPFTELYDGYHCFGCSKRNTKGFHLDFYRKGRAVYSIWNPDRDLQGYHNLLHGGIQATLMDEISAWWIYTVAGTAGLTSKLSIRYLKSVSILEGQVFLRAMELERRRNIYTLKGELFSHSMELCARAELDFFTYPMEKAMDEMYYPGLEKFSSTIVESRDQGFPDALFAAEA